MLLHREIKREEEDGKVVVLRHRGFRSSHLHKNMDSSSVQFSSVVVVIVVVVEESPIHAWSNSKKKLSDVEKEKKNIYTKSSNFLYLYKRVRPRETRATRNLHCVTYAITHRRAHLLYKIYKKNE